MSPNNRYASKPSTNLYLIWVDLKSYHLFLHLLGSPPNDILASHLLPTLPIMSWLRKLSGLVLEPISLWEFDLTYWSSTTRESREWWSVTLYFKVSVSREKAMKRKPAKEDFDEWMHVTYINMTYIIIGHTRSQHVKMKVSMPVKI